MAKEKQNFSQAKIDIQKSFEKRNFYTLSDSGWMFLFAVVLPLATGSILGYIALYIAQACGFQFASENATLTELLQAYIPLGVFFVMLSELVFLVLFFVFHKANRIQLSAVKLSIKKAKPLTAILCMLAGIVCVAGFVWLVEGCIGSLIRKMDIQHGYSLPLDNIGWLILNLFLLGVIPAICEEIIFRGVIFQGLRERFSGIASCLITGLLFALMHENIEQFVYPFVLGFVLSLVMERTGNLLYPILLHLFNNVATIVLSYLVNIGAVKLAFNVSWWGWLVAILIAAVTLVLLWLCDKFYLQKQTKIEIEKNAETTKQNFLLKIPVTMIVGMAFAVLVVVINLVV